MLLYSVFQDKITKLRWKILTHKTRLTPPPFIEMPVLSQGSERSCICVLGVSICPLYTIFLFIIGVVPNVWYVLLFILFPQILSLFPCKINGKNTCLNHNFRHQKILSSFIE